MRPGPRRALLFGIVAAISVAAYFVRRIPQDPAYNGFADRRTLLGVPNALDVLSNVPFLVVGLMGLWTVMRRQAQRRDPEAAARAAWLRWPYGVLFLGTLLTAFGSAWYHLAPSNARLVWDRLPMTLAFMGLMGALIAEFSSVRLARWLLVPLIAFGLWSVMHWRLTELRGDGDLRPYAVVQFGSLMVGILLVMLSPPPRPGWRLLVVALGGYVAAKLLEMFDHQIYAMLGVVSGHTLKHLAAAVGVYALLVRWRRQAS
ncbi:MAG: ceramidase domain-containing protein [Planctomycetota bacterium]